MKLLLPYILLMLLAVTACDSARPEQEVETFVYTLEGSVTGGVRIECDIVYSTPEERRHRTAVGLMGELPTVPFDNATGLRAECEGRSSTETMRVELSADGETVDFAETTNPEAGIVVEHGHILPR